MARGNVVGSIPTPEHTRTHPECEGCPLEMCNPPQCKGLAHALQQCTEKPVDITPVLEEHYGAEVWTDREMDTKRRERCLCLRCKRDADSCTSACDLLYLCRATNMALMVTRCPRFAMKGG